MSKLKVLSQDDLATISDDFGEILENEISKALPSKEIEDLDLDILLSYENSQLDVDVDVGVSFDELSEITQDQIAKAIDEAYVRFDSYIDENFRV
jgi:transcriptional regulator NrdR family protein